jgi:hypothetical protein
MSNPNDTVILPYEFRLNPGDRCRLVYMAQPCIAMPAPPEKISGQVGVMVRPIYFDMIYRSSNIVGGVPFIVVSPNEIPESLFQVPAASVGIMKEPPPAKAKSDDSGASNTH